MLERTTGLQGCWEETAGRDCQGARKDHRDARMLGRATGMPLGHWEGALGCWKGIWGCQERCQDGPKGC